MNRRIKQRQRQSRSITAMKNRKNNLEVGQRVYVDFLSSNRVETDGTRISGFGVLDRVENDGFVCGRLDNGQPFGCQSEYVQLETKVIGVDLGEEPKPVPLKTRDFTVTVVVPETDGHLMCVFLKDIKGKTIGQLFHSLIFFKMDLLEGWGSQIMAEHHYKGGLPVEESV
ncbi:hypothetical protein [Acinetobacter baumannii]|uniref:hypothetical protein n=1 Tax=Acinetobacter baumannii TaxID=470 RepID=UPI0025428B27|nr:hypothetical protein [Acinetobacter baumannii]WIH75499.1 hypothetical protein M2A29_05610 [Acinetobacter baumannii]